MTISTIFIICSMIIIIGMIISIFFDIKFTNKLPLYITLCTTSFAGICIFLLVICVTLEAHDRGFEGDTIQSQPIELFRQNRINHQVELEYTPQDGDIVIYVRYGCPGCELIYNELSTIAQNNKNIYFISTRTDTGRTLMETYPTTSVPSAVLIGSNIPYVSLIYTTEYGDLIFDESALNELLTIRNNNQTEQES